MQNVQISLPLLRLPISASVSLAGTKSGAGDQPGADLFSLDLASDGTDTPLRVSAPTAALPEAEPEGPDLADSYETCDLPLATGGHEADRTRRNNGFAFVPALQYRLPQSDRDPEAEEILPDDKPAPAPPHPTGTRQAEAGDFARVGDRAAPAPPQYRLPQSGRDPEAEEALPDHKPAPALPHPTETNQATECDLARVRDRAAPAPISLPGGRETRIICAAPPGSGKLPEPIWSAVPDLPDGPESGTGNLPVAPSGQSLLQPANPSPDVTSDANPERRAQPRIPDPAAAAPPPLQVEPFGPANGLPEPPLAPTRPLAIETPPSAHLPRAESTREWPAQRHLPPLPPPTGAEPGRLTPSPPDANVNTGETSARIAPEPARLAAPQQSHIAGAVTGSTPLSDLTDQVLPAVAAPLPPPSRPAPPQAEVKPQNLAPLRNSRTESLPLVMPVIAVASRSAVPGHKAETAEPVLPENVRTAANTEIISRQPAASAVTRTESDPLANEAPLPAGTGQSDPGTAPLGTYHMPTGREIPPHHVAPATRPEMPAQVPAQISQAVINAGGPVTELRLSPEELGTVRIEVKTEREKVTVTLLAERPETLDLLRRHADRLVAEFRAAGFSEMNLGFGNLSAGDQGGAQPGPAPSVPEMTEAAISAATPISAPETRSGPQASLYLRL
ncbi:hook-length control protein FliK [Rhodobacter sp. 24-YEA-8]|nr:hook-length control protein FliK [Rhodobacter sp. 24-YEA-8]